MFKILLGVLAILDLVVGSVNLGIIGGHDSNITRHAWQLSLQFENKHFCGAALIAIQFALTAARCITKHSSGLSVRAGSSYTSSGGQVFGVEEVIVHPGYDHVTHDSDIAILKFSENITTNHAFPAALPYNNAEIARFSPTTITGWGRTALGGDYPEVLQMVQVSAMNRQDCQEAYPFNTITANMFCAGYLGIGNRTACDGDFGGPIIVYNRLVGIGSWVRSCGKPSWPSVFTRVANFKPWIKQHTGVDSFKIKDYSHTF